MCNKQKNRTHGFCAAAVCAASVLLASACIDEDLSVCGVTYAVDYSLELSLSLQQELDRQLTTPAEQALAVELRKDLERVLTDRAQIMDLSFFYTSDGSLAEHFQEKPDANQLSMSVYMQPDNYHNVALAATDREEAVRIQQSSSYGGIQLRVADTDTVDTQGAAIYMGYKMLTVDRQSDHFHVPLYMQNAVPVLVVDRNNSPARPLKAYTRRMASAFLCADSAFTFERPVVSRTLHSAAGQLEAYHTVCFPSANEALTRAEASDEAKGSIWEMDLYTQLPDGKYVKNVLYMKNPLKAGELQVIKVKLNEEGEVVTENPEVGVSVELDWKPGGDFDVEI